MFLVAILCQEEAKRELPLDALGEVRLREKDACLWLRRGELQRISEALLKQASISVSLQEVIRLRRQPTWREAERIGKGVMRSRPSGLRLAVCAWRWRLPKAQEDWAISSVRPRV